MYGNQKKKKPQIAKAILRKKNGTGGNNLPTQALLQSHSHQDSMILAQRQKYRSMEQNRKPRDKEARIYNGKKTTSLTSGAGKTGQPLVKE